MTQDATVYDNAAPEAVENDLVPANWKALFNNAEWLVHRIVVLSTYGMVAIVLLAHLLVWFWRPWLVSLGV